jgi:uncharacterized RDD family membrane protein YckC
MYSKEEILEMLSSDKTSTREEACECLRSSRESSPEIVRALDKATHDEDPEVALRATYALQADVHHQMAIDMGVVEPDQLAEETMVEKDQSEIEPGVIVGKKFGPRAAAYLVDMLTIFGLNSIVGFVGGAFLGLMVFFVKYFTGGNIYLEDQDLICDNYIIGITLTMTYFAIFEWLYGRTIGKVIFGQQVINSDGNTCTLKQAFIRAIYRFIDGIFFGLVAYYHMKPPGNQRLGDKRASTFVVSSKEAVIKDHPAWWKFFIALVVYLFFAGLISMLWLLLYIRFE